MLLINTEEHLKAWQSYCRVEAPLKKKDKGRFGEELAFYVLESKFEYKLIYKNLRTPYGEIDLVLKGDGFVLFVEVKVDLVGRDGDDVWSRAQRQRFRRSQAWYAKREFCKVLGGVVLIKKDKMLFLELGLV